MEVALGHHDWRVLRKVLRSKGKPLVGRELRMDMSRRTKDGTFLERLVEDGLLETKKNDSDPFEATYAITALGKEAAEHGVYDIAWEVLKARRGPGSKRA